MGIFYEIFHELWWITFFVLWHSFLTIFKFLILQSHYNFQVVIKTIKYSNLLYKDDLFWKLGTASDVTRKGTVDAAFFKRKF